MTEANVFSCLSDVVWPAIPATRAAQLLAVQFQLDQTQWLTPNRLLMFQVAQLRRVTEFVYVKMPFYKDRFDAVGLRPDTIRNLDDWRRLPLLTRLELQVAGEALHAECANSHGEHSLSMTSGSTGSPLASYATNVSRLFWSAFTIRDHLWHKRDFNSKLAVIRSIKQDDLPEGESDNWGVATRGVIKTGPVVGLDVNRSVEEQANWLQKHDPHYLLTYPSNALALAQHFQTTGQTLRNLREVRTLGELVEPRVRQACLAAWKAKLTDAYSAQEVGYLAIQCPDYEHYHVQSENVLLEVLHPDSGLSCQPGEIGRVVITTLNNFAMPLIRYEIGDYAEVGAPCRCGRGLPVLTRIVGRQRNMVVLPDGSTHWPSVELSGAQVKEFPPVLQFQLIQRTREAVDLLLVVARQPTVAEEDILRSWVVKALGYPFAVTLRYVPEIPRGPGGKFEDFRCEVE